MITRWKIFPDIIRWALIIGILCEVFFLIFSSNIPNATFVAILWIPLGLILLLKMTSGLVGGEQNMTFGKKRHLIFTVITIAIFLTGVFFTLFIIAATGEKRSHPFLKRIFAPFIGPPVQRSVPKRLGDNGLGDQHAFSRELGRHNIQ